MQMQISMPDYARRRLRLAATGLPDDIDPFGAQSPWFTPLDEFAEQTGEAFATLSHYDYLSLARHPEVVAAASDAVQRFGVGAGASRLIGGERSIHRAFESELADFLGTEASLAITSGFLVNFSLIPHLVGPNDMIVMDELMHSSATYGAKGSRAKVFSFAHNDMDHLERILCENRGKHGFCLILSEGLFSMDGDIPDLPKLVALRDRHAAWLMVDEAHSTGVLGETGRGLCEHYGMPADCIDILAGTLSKTFVSMGGFIAGRKETIDWIRFTLPSFVFSVGLSPVIVETARAALRIIRAEPQRVTRLRDISNHVMRSARDAGFNTGGASGQAIVPILFEHPSQAARASRALAREGIYAPPIVHVGIGEGLSRIRLFLSADLQRSVAERALAVMSETACHND